MSEEIVTEKNEKDNLTRCDHLRLEAYRTLDRWNDHDAKVLLPFDGVVLVLLSLTIFSPDNGNKVMWLNIGLPAFGLVVVGMWLLLSKRQFNRIRQRYILMKAIEGKLKFSAHTAVYEFMQSENLQRLTFWHLRCVIGVFLFAVLVSVLCINICQ